MMFLKRLFILLLAAGIISGCGGGGDNAKEDKNDGAKVQNKQENGKDEDKTRMQVADKAQSKIEQLDEVRHATVIVANRNAYVAVVLDDQPKGEVRNDVERKISDQVKEVDDNIEDVFVSGNPDFVDRMEDYGDKIQSGKPVRGLFEEFNEMVQRVFPTTRQ
jgi:spore cortex protein